MSKLRKEIEKSLESIKPLIFFDHRLYTGKDMVDFCISEVNKRTNVDNQEIYSSLSRMREEVLLKHPEWLGGMVTDVLECVLCIEKFQKELLEKHTCETCKHQNDPIDSINCNNCRVRMTSDWEAKK